MKFCYKDIYLDWRIVGLIVGLCFLHAFTIRSNVAYIISFVEIFILFYFCILGKIDKFLICSMILLMTTYEFPTFIDGSLSFIPSITMLPFLRGYLFLFLSVFPLLKVSNIRVWKKISNYPSLYLLFLFALLSLVLGLIFGIVTLFVDKLPFPFWLSFYFKDMIGVGLFSLYAIYFIYTSLKDNKFILKIERILFSALVAIVISALILTVLGFRGDYEGQEIVLMPLSFFFSILILLFLFYDKYVKRYRLLIIIIGGMSVCLQILMSNALNGKSWLLVIYILLFFLIVGFKINKKIAILFCFFICGVFPLLLSYSQQNKDSLSLSKLSQALSLLSVVEVDWYDTLPLSPKIRIEEFFNTSLEYVNFPCFAICGKGYGGGHRDNRYIYGYYNSAAFSLDEYNNEYFVSMHESLNMVFLKNGILGLLFVFFLLIYIGKNILCSPWLSIGGIWFLFFWGYSYSLMSVGLPALIIGLYYIKPIKLQSKE